MGKRKKPHNVIKVDLGANAFGKGNSLPVVIHQSSKDGRRLEKTTHNIPEPPEKPPSSNFDPSPVYEATQGCGFPEVPDPTDKRNVPERVSSRVSLQGVLL
jgi:hypothetical protein